MRIGRGGFIELGFFERVPCAAVGAFAHPAGVCGAAVGANEDGACLAHDAIIASRTGSVRCVACVE